MINIMQRCKCSQRYLVEPLNSTPSIMLSWTTCHINVDLGKEFDNTNRLGDKLKM